MTTFQTIRHIIESIEIFLRILFVKIIQVRFYQFKLKDFIKEFFLKFEFSHLKHIIMVQESNSGRVLIKCRAKLYQTLVTEPGMF